ncbi:MAG: M56 family metallopeptidase, partial [Spirochaetes bacterium]|nr:M56 family metallopeptidase [Spirochaetota bacterium]
MNQLYDYINFISQKFLYLSINLIIKSALLVLISVLLLIIFKRISSKIKHLIWFFTIIVIAVLPLLNNIFFNFKFFHEKIVIINELKNGLIKVPNKISLDEINYKNELLKYNNSGSIKYDFIKKVHFSEVIFFMWVMIFIFLSIYFITGYIKTYKIIKSSYLMSDKKIIKIIEEFKKNNKYKKDVTVYLNSKCIIPVALYFFKNIILLPENVVRWDKKKLMPALFHELTHIQRNDCIIHNISRIICYFYWFNPFIWYAFNKLKIEQEHACDFNVVDKGINPFEYAEILLNFASNFNDSNNSCSPVSVSFIRESCLENRIYNIIKLKPDFIKSYFKKPFIVMIIFFFIFLFLSLVNPVNISSENEIINLIIHKYKNFNGLVNLSNFPPVYKQVISDFPVIWPMLDYAKISDVEYNIFDKKLK